MIAVDVAGREVLVCHTREGWFAIDNVCTHAYARLSEGRLRGSRVVCPLHGGSFDCRMSCARPARGSAAEISHVRVVGEDVEVALTV